MKMKYDSHTKINRPWSNIYKKETIDGKPYLDGLCYSKYGVVECTSDHLRKMSYFRFVYKGTLYMRTIDKAYSERGLAIMAGKYVNDVIENAKL